MNISAKVEYACIATIELALNYHEQQPVRLAQIAERHGIPPRFLVQILLQLKAGGLVTSTRGAAGGYRLNRDPQEITLDEVMRVVEGQPAELTGAAHRDTPVAQALFTAWRQIAAVQRQMLGEITFAQLADQARSPTAEMYYI